MEGTRHVREGGGEGGGDGGGTQENAADPAHDGASPPEDWGSGDGSNGITSTCCAPRMPHPPTPTTRGECKGTHLYMLFCDGTFRSPIRLVKSFWHRLHCERMHEGEQNGMGWEGSGRTRRRASTTTRPYATCTTGSSVATTLARSVTTVPMPGLRSRPVCEEKTKTNTVLTSGRCYLLRLRFVFYRHTTHCPRCCPSCCPAATRPCPRPCPCPACGGCASACCASCCRRLSFAAFHCCPACSTPCCSHRRSLVVPVVRGWMVPAGGQCREWQEHNQL